MKQTVWRSNLISCCFLDDKKEMYRKFVMDTIDAIAHIHQLDCGAMIDSQLSGVPVKNSHSVYFCDVIFLRSTPRTVISRDEFEKMIVSVFDKTALGIQEEWFLCSMKEQYLNKYPFPKK